MKRKQILFTLLVFVLSIFLLTGCKTKTKSTVTTKDNTSQTQPTQSGSSTSQTTKGGSSSSTTGGGNQSSVTVTPTQTTPKPVELKEGWEHDSEHHWRVNVDETDTQHYEEAAHDAGEWVIVTPASCTLEGLKELRCTVCGYVLRTEAIEKTAHNFEVEYKYENEQLVKVSSCKDCDAEEKNNAEPNTPSEIPTLTEGGVYVVYGKVLRFETNKIILADATGSNETEFVLYRTKNANQYTDLVVGDFVLATGKMSHYTNGTEDFYEFNEGTILVSKAHEVRIYIDTENVQVQGTTDKVNTHETIVFTLSSLDQSKKLGAVKVNGVTVTPESEGENAGKYVVLVTADVHITAELIDVCAEFKSGYTQLAGLEVGQVLITTKASDGKIYYLVPAESTSNPGSRLTTDPTTLNTANLWTVTKEGDVYFFSFVENGTTYYLNRNGNKANTKITAEKGSGWAYENGSLKQDGKYLGIYERDKDFRAYDNNEHANFISGTGKGFVFYSYSEGLVYNHTLDKTEAQAAKLIGHAQYVVNTSQMKQLKMKSQI